MKYLKAIIFIFLGACCLNGQDADFNLDISKMMLKGDVNYLSSDHLEGRKVGTPGELMAAGYIFYRYAELGLLPKGDDRSYLQKFTVRERANPHITADSDEDKIIVGYNVVSYIDHGAPNTIIIGAHYDHLGYGGGFGSLHAGEPEIHNGADDNASGVAGLLRLAYELKTGPKNNNYLFIAFSGEEQGLWGSNYFSKNPTLDIGTVNYMINMDMIGRMKENKISINGVGTSPVFDNVIDKVNEHNLHVIKGESGMGPSDHTSFYTKDIPVLHFFTGQHSDYHKPTDDADKINYDGIIKTTDFIINIIKEIDDDGKIEFTKTKEEASETPRFKVTLGVMPDYMYDGKGMRIDGVTEGRPASAADLKAGDVVIKLGDEEVFDMMSYMKALSLFNEGDETTVEIKRGKKILKKRIKFTPKQ